MSDGRQRPSAPQATLAQALQLRQLDAVDLGEWDELLAGDPRSHLFQRPHWTLRYARHHARCSAHWLEARDARGRLCGGLPLVRVRRLWLCALASGIGGTYGGPVVRADVPQAEALLLAAFLRAGGARVLRRELVWRSSEPPRGGAGRLAAIESGCLDLVDGFERFWSDVFPKNRRNECNRSERRGLRVEASRDPDLLVRFAPLYRAMARRWGVAAEPLPFLAAVLAEEQDAVLFAARRGDELLGAHLCLRMGDELFAWIGTTARADDVFPSALLIKEEARWAAARGLRRINLGSSLGLSGVAEYKRLLGARPVVRWLLVDEPAPLRLLRRRPAGAAW